MAKGSLLEKRPLLAVLLVVVAIIVLKSVFRSRETTTAEGAAAEGAVEQFVASNSREVGKKLSSITELDALALRSVFRAVVDADAGSALLNVSSFPPMRKTTYIREQALQYMDDILARIARRSDRHFHVLDVQSVGKEVTFDPTDRGLVERYMVNLFVQEKDKRQVHASAHNISMTFMVKPSTGELAVAELYFITDHFYDRPLVDGDNKFDRFFRIKNPFHLQQPFFTTDDKVLPPDDQQIAVLRDHHKDLRTPQYRCFGATGEASTQSQCNLASGFWDRPVQTDEECPFYKANQNYVNRLGGVHPDGEFCEMPVNMKRIGYRFVSSDPQHKPWCYNCRIGADGNPGSAGPCCDEQRNKQLYPNLKGPDYMFPGDVLERGQHWNELAERGLNWRRHPTSIRDVTNPRQRQPVFNAIIGPGPGKLDPQSYPN
jgi:hypothetical protein